MMLISDNNISLFILYQSSSSSLKKKFWCIEGSRKNLEFGTKISSGWRGIVSWKTSKTLSRGIEEEGHHREK